jgi:hypothetical protein
MQPAPHMSLLDKLGYQSGEAVDTLNAPEWFLEYLRGNGVHTHAKLPTEWLHIFMTKREHLAHFMRGLKLNEVQNGLWVSWPRPATDISEQGIRGIITPYGWISTKACIISDDWDAIEFTRNTAR